MRTFPTYRYRRLLSRPHGNRLFAKQLARRLIRTVVRQFKQERV